jgi:hypothetical protein
MKWDGFMYYTMQRNTTQHNSIAQRESGLFFPRLIRLFPFAVTLGTN